MSMDKKNTYRHTARDRQEGESDIKDKFKIIDILRDAYGLHGLTDEILQIPEGYADCRKPDVFVKGRSPQLVIELNGSGVHGYGDNVTTPEHDFEKMSDYSQLKGIQVIVLYSARTDGYRPDLVMKEFDLRGLERKSIRSS